MQTAAKSDQPITGLCIVSDPTKCPPGYDLIYRSYDKKDDCDLWKDSWLRSRVTRYLCLSRVFPLDGGRVNNVLADIVINNDKDLPPDGFSLIDFTVDSREKATRKKQICVKMIPRGSTTDAISDLIILSRTKRAPVGYTLVGEMNGLLLCYQMGKVPPDNGTTPAADSNSTEQPSAVPNYTTSAPVVPIPYQNNVSQSPTLPPVERTADISTGTGSLQRHRSLVREDSVVATTALSGVPFQFGSHFVDVHTLNNIPNIDISYRSRVDIDNEYNYPFRIEQTAVARQISWE